MIHCRRATIQDSEVMSQLSHQLGYISTTEEIMGRLTRLSSLTDHYVCVAEINSEVVGWGHVQGMHSIESPSCRDWWTGCGWDSSRDGDW
ncbi:hypothetical protein [Paenibacillus sp. PCH8]|uniref:hypothetical protein n=1 Tax=Paenibacillus sp. PCH8 TaxID=2066524 RepID=UPI0011B0E96C|nr:hypothetical protein [Paenibacillus sp. PCH8]